SLSSYSFWGPGQCIVAYWQQAQWRGGPIRCPVCRQQVNILLPCFNTQNLAPSAPPASPDDQDGSSQPALTAATADQSHRQLVREINRYNRRFSGEPRPVSGRSEPIPAD